MLVNRHFANFTGINSTIPRIKNAKFSGHYFYMNTNIKADFQICISVPLKRPCSFVHTCDERYFYLHFETKET